MTTAGNPAVPARSPCQTADDRVRADGDTSLVQQFEQPYGYDGVPDLMRAAQRDGDFAVIVCRGPQSYASPAPRA